MSTTTWAGQIGSDLEIDVRPVPDGRRTMPAGTTMLYPSARLLNDTIRAIPPGESITVREMRVRLAHEYGADFTCPVTTTRMLRIVVEATNEARERGTPVAEVTPVWRALEKSAAALRGLTFDPAWIVAERAREQVEG